MREKRPVASDLICLLFYRICGKIARKKGAAIETEQQTENFTVFKIITKFQNQFLTNDKNRAKITAIV